MIEYRRWKKSLNSIFQLNCLTTEWKSIISENRLASCNRFVFDSAYLLIDFSSVWISLKTIYTNTKFPMPIVKAKAIKKNKNTQRRNWNAKANKYPIGFRHGNGNLRTILISFNLFFHINFGKNNGSCTHQHGNGSSNASLPKSLV